ncbi:MAG: long-chain fatty acid--CoA ligase [Candidatus Dormibacteria bacterium]
MQEHPLNIPSILRHAERMHPNEKVTTRVEEGLRITSFAEVMERTRRLATALAGLGVKPDDRVATFCWNSQQHLEAYTAVPCIGAILHTLNIRLFAQDLAYIVEHAQDSVVIVDLSLWTAWEKVAALVGCVQTTVVINDTGGLLPEGTVDYEDLLAAHRPMGEFPEIPETQAAAMCYTSGTTGHPKGVLYSHRSNWLHSYATGLVDVLALCQRDVTLPVVPMFHANAWGIPYAALLHGCDLVLPSRFMTPQALSDLMIDTHVTLGFGVPTIWLGMLEHLKARKEELGSLQRIVCGGSAVPPSLQKSYHDALGVRIIHAWGMTETSPLVTLCMPMAKHESLDPGGLDQLLSLQGRAAAGTELRIMSDDGNEAPWDGETVGEIQVRGNWIAAAYYNDDTSSEKFADGWLRTGDVGSIDADGYIRITDRTKDLVKSGGEWISSVELEGLIMSHPDVAEAAVIAVAHARWSERPLACVVPRPEAKGTLTRESVLEHLRPRVARWWLPDDVVFIDEVPKTSVLKFDKKVLRERFKDYQLPEVAGLEPVKAPPGTTAQGAR